MSACIAKISIINFYKQLFGRAGRGGMPSIAHLFYSCKKKFDDKQMEIFVRSEGCRRNILINSIGGSLRVTPTECCDICSARPVSSRLNIFSAVVAKKKRRRAIRTVDEEMLEQQLMMTRDDFLKRNSDFQIVGKDFICPDLTVKRICDESKYIGCIDDLPAQLRLELKDLFFCDIVACSLSSTSTS